MRLLILVVDDEPDIESLFRQQFRRELRAERFVMAFALSAQAWRSISMGIAPSSSTQTEAPPTKHRPLWPIPWLILNRSSSAIGKVPCTES